MPAFARTRIPLLLILCLILPLSAAAALVNLNTADAALLDTLPGIGPSKASAIIDYRTQHGPFARIEDIQNVSGIGASTYATIAPLITVGDTPPDTPTATSTATVSSTGAATYVPPPASISVSINGDDQARVEVPLILSAVVKTRAGDTDAAARISWSFGDGSASEGRIVEKTYHYPGTYLVRAIATDGATVGKSDLTVTVRNAQVRIVAVSGEGITVTNEEAERLDLSGWRLSADTGFFRIPDGTTLLPNASVLFPSAVTNLPVALRATLSFPNGVLAASFAPAVQPPALVARSMLVQPVEPALSTIVSAPAHDTEAARAPTAAMELAAVGAATLPPADAAAVPSTSARTNLLRSPWALGLLGVIALAGGAFMIL